MSLGDRCDEILRLIDETLTGLGLDAGAGGAKRPAVEPVLATVPDRRRAAGREPR